MQNLIIGLVVLAWLIYRQLQVRNVRDSSNWILLIVLAGYGLVTTVDVANKHHPSTGVVALLVASLLISGVFGAIRAATVRIWADNGQLLRQGTWLTALLWIVSIAVHLGFDVAMDKAGGPKGLGTASIMLYLAITWGVQSVIVQRRAEPHRQGITPPPQQHQDQDRHLRRQHLDRHDEHHLEHQERRDEHHQQHRERRDARRRNRR
jgi:hypothetical protein